MAYLIKSDSPQGDRLYLIKSGDSYAINAGCAARPAIHWASDPDVASLFEDEDDAEAFLEPFGWSLDHPDFKLVPVED